MQQWWHIFIKYLRYELNLVVLRCHPSEDAVRLANFKEKSEGDVGPGSRSTWNFDSIFCINQWTRPLNITTGN